MTANFHNVFEVFKGADLDRFVKCIEAIRNEGLNVSGYTDYGVNNTSGNVWVYSEDWAGCVYCSIGFDVAWCYSCPDCGEEHDFSTYRKMVDYVNQYDSQCSACANEE